MGDNLIAHPSLDFSHYQPGDQIVIDRRTIIEIGQTDAILLTAAIANAASRAGLNWSTERRMSDDALVVSFSDGARKPHSELPEAGTASDATSVAK